jgi:hypothetical protein
MKKVVLFVLAISVVIISCYKSVPGNLTYSINTSGDSTVPTVYMPQTGSYNLPLEVKYLAGYSEDLVTISISGLPSGIKITPDSFTAVPTYSANFVLSDSNVALHVPHEIILILQQPQVQVPIPWLSIISAVTVPMST